jgi:hypothetical protein
MSMTCSAIPMRQPRQASVVRVFLGWLGEVLERGQQEVFPGRPAAVEGALPTGARRASRSRESGPADFTCRKIEPRADGPFGCPIVTEPYR